MTSRDVITHVKSIRITAIRALRSHDVNFSNRVGKCFTCDAVSDTISAAGPNMEYVMCYDCYVMTGSNIPIGDPGLFIEQYQATHTLAKQAAVHAIAIDMFARLIITSTPCVSQYVCDICGVYSQTASAWIYADDYDNGNELKLHRRHMCGQCTYAVAHHRSVICNRLVVSREALRMHAIHMNADVLAYVYELVCMVMYN